MPVPTRAAERILVAQIGARMHYAVPEILAGAGRLAALHTDMLAPEGGLRTLLKPFARLGPIRRLQGRRVSPRLREHTTEHPGVALDSMLRLKLLPGRRRETYLRSGERFAHAVAASGMRGVDGVYCFTGGALEILEAAQKAGIPGTLEQFIAAQSVRDRILRTEHEAFPDWEGGGTLGFLPPELEGRFAREWALADRILCPSEFVRRSLAAEGVDPRKLVVVPYGVALPEMSGPAPARAEGPLRVLFVGSVELRKGIHHAAEALRRLGPGTVEMRVVGPVWLTERRRAELSALCDLRGQVPRAEIRAHFDWADVLLLPSLVEGSATVTYEALVRGIPVVCTENAGSIVRDGETGLIVAPRDPDAVAAALDRLAEDRQLLSTMSRTAWERRREASLDAYRDRLLEVL